MRYKRGIQCGCGVICAGIGVAADVSADADAPDTGGPVLDDRLCIPAVGADGNQQPLGTPNSPSANFLQALPGACQ